MVVGLAGFLAGPVPAQVVDYGKIERTIAKEPAYKTEAPKYCLVVFGPKAKTRVWLVLDGDTLYVDRHANGDLTKGHRCVIKGQPGWQAGTEVCTITSPHGDGEFNLEVCKEDNGEAKDEYLIWCNPKEGTGFSQRTVGPVFGDRPKDAPIVHFAGPLTLTLMDWHRPLQPRQLFRGDKDNQLSILLGTPVYGGKREAFATFFHSLPQVTNHSGFPTVEIEFPISNPDGPPIQARVAFRY
jgi:hypothetical protein